MSGLSHTPGKRARGKTLRGFESRLLRQSMCCKWLIVNRFSRFGNLPLSNQLSKCRNGFVTAFCFVRPTWAHSWRCKSSRERVTVSEVKRHCMRVTECGKAAWSINCEPMDRNRIEGVAEQGERARNRKAFVTKAQAM